MKKFYLLLSILIAISLTSNGGNGDSTFIQAHNAVHMNYYGNFDVWTNFPTLGTSYGKVLMRYRMGCPSTGCSPWDYTTQVFARIKTGTYDSTLTQYPNFTLNGSQLDTAFSNSQPNYLYFFNTSTLATDSTLQQTDTIIVFGDSLNPSISTDTLYHYPANYYNYIYNSNGQKTDSIYVSYDNAWYLEFINVYSAPFEVLEPFELSRVMTPYAQGFPLTWKRDFWYDVTDYQNILRDSVLMRVFYDGYSDGFTADISFVFIEGTPPRNPIRALNIYPTKYYKYGFTNDPIENYINAKSYFIQPNEAQALIRVIPSGHSFGGALNCAEFCQKNYRWLVNGVQRFQQLIWRNDCGMNPQLAQPGTWLYDRSNWCPGDKALNREHELTPYIIPGDSVTIDMNFDSYTYSGGAGFDPGYYLTAHLITYDTLNFSNNAAIEQIVAPNIEFEHSRFNPICNNPIIRIKNNGANTLTSCTINYGIKGGTVQTYNWTGSLDFNNVAQVTLGSLAWGSASNTPDDFEVWLVDVNGVADEYHYDDTLRSKTNFTPVYPSQFMLQWKTNNAANETTYQLRNDAGVIIYQNGVLSANTIYRDTFNLLPGCYELKINDSGKDGLSFFANSDGSGYARLVKTDGTGQILKLFTADFGTAIYQRFTVGYMTDLPETVSNTVFELSPNPTTGKFAINLILAKNQDIKITVINQLGQIVYERNENNFLQDMLEIDLNNAQSGMYFVNLETEIDRITKKIIIE